MVSAANSRASPAARDAPEARAARRARPPRHRLGSMRDRVIRTERSGRPVSNDVSHSIIDGLYTRNASTSEARHNFMRADLWHPPHGGT